MKHAGSCHCGKVRFEADMELKEAMSCNCSLCQKRGSLLAFIPEEQFTMLSGEDNLTDYQFNKKVIHHYFCKTCGILPFGAGKGPDGASMRAINLRCLDDVDLDSITIQPFDGRSV